MFSFFAKIRDTWRLMGCSWRLLMQDRELLLFPLCSGLSCILVIISFFVPVAVFLTSPSFNPEDANEGIGYLLLFLFYFVNYFVITFFNVAIISGAIERISGGDPTFQSCLKAAVARLPQILGWAIVSATIGVALRIIESKSPKVGRFIATLLGSAWTITTFLVVPVIVVERSNPLDACAKSVALLKRTWGEQITSGVAFGVIFFFLSLPGIALFFIAPFFMIARVWMAATVFITAVVYLVALALIQSALYSIFQAALYMYAENGRAPESFDREALAGALV